MKTATFEKATNVTNAINEHFGGELAGKNVTVWGCSNGEGRLDEITCSVIGWLVRNNANVSVHDDAVIAEVNAHFGTSVSCPEKKWDAVRHADAVVIASHDATYCNVDAGRLTWSVTERSLFDVHGSVSRDSLQYSSFAHFTFTRETRDDNGTTVTLPFRDGRSATKTNFATAALALVG